MSELAVNYTVPELAAIGPLHDQVYRDEPMEDRARDLCQQQGLIYDDGELTHKGRREVLLMEILRPQGPYEVRRRDE